MLQRHSRCLPGAAPPAAAAIVLALLVWTGAPAPAGADDVHLVNGEVFEGVLAERRGEEVVIRLPYGDLTLPATRVRRIERADSPFETFLERKRALAPGSAAADWLALALWAREVEFLPGVREASLRAAALEPALEGLSPLLRGLGYALDEATGTWILHDELMRRRGYVRIGDEWIPGEVVAAEARRVASERAADAEARRQAQLDRAITLLALSEINELEREARQPVIGIVSADRFGRSVAVFTGGVFAGPVRPQALRPPRGRGPHPAPDALPPSGAPHHGVFSYDALAGRQPGSILPLAVDPGAARTSTRASRGGAER